MKLTLSELIAKCGQNFRYLELGYGHNGKRDTWYACYKPDSKVSEEGRTLTQKNIRIQGSTPEEAMEKLYSEISKQITCPTYPAQMIL